ncbi:MULTISPECIES: lysylphosphatidylglycerol synthase transmembrane domain-containing protein [unclassified Methanosarcina]|uniref:lysylphosphatidylglycerol synthase transmembrane domain-containing protein n=1 Tax=unclassified Methanosarcina TaxID=2644672 RepID=UPI0025E2C29E|nr:MULTISPECIES: lysylphosphatidylglycerol synthase transmembrane domain-containing protein [unclassified Methanosarcina]
MDKGILKKAILALLLLTAGVFLISIYWADIVPVLRESLKILSKTKISYFILAFLAYLLSVYLFAVRWQQVLSCLGYDLKPTDLVPVIFGGIFANNLTPASRAGGEPLRIIWVNKQFGISYTNAFVSILFERLVEAIPITMLLIYVLYSFPSLDIKFLPVKTSFNLSSTYLLLLVFLVVGVIIWIFRKKLSSLLESIYENWRQLRKSFVSVLLLSSGVWILDIIRLKLIALALNLPLSLYLIATASILYLLLGSLPITPGGLGIVEGGLISVLRYLGLSLASASSFVFLERFISFGLSSVIGFLCLFYYGGFKIWKNIKSH